MAEFYKTKVILEVEVEHQFDPQQGIGIVVGRLSGYDIPAVTSVEVVEASSNYALHSKPLDELHPVDISEASLFRWEKLKPQGE